MHSKWIRILVPLRLTVVYLFLSSKEAPGWSGSLRRHQGGNKHAGKEHCRGGSCQCEEILAFCFLFQLIGPVHKIPPRASAATASSQDPSPPRSYWTIWRGTTRSKGTEMQWKKDKREKLRKIITYPLQVLYVATFLCFCLFYKDHFNFLSIVRNACPL